MSIFKKDKDRKYFISYPTVAIRHVRAICGCILHWFGILQGRGKCKKSEILIPQFCF